jgi:membrane associated rhomboid family serine protease
MMPRGSALVMLVVGVLLALVSIFADALGVGGEPGFGYKQAAGLVVGVVLAVIGFRRRR